MYTWNDGTYLMHHGIKGQKWGVRRFQNEDGSYTSRGQAENGGRGRYGLGDALNTVNKVATAVNQTNKTVNRVMDEYENKKQQISNKVQKLKKVAKVGAGIAVGALVVYGGVKASKFIKQEAKNKTLRAGEYAISSLMEKGAFDNGFDFYKDYLNKSLKITAAENSGSLSRAIQTLKGNRKLSEAELENLGIDIAPAYSFIRRNKEIFDSRFG